jgi:two-component system cell cycle response regulator DivK
MRGDDRLGLHAETIGAGDQVWLVIFKEAECRRQHGRFTRPRAQIRRRQTGGVEQPQRAIGFGQRPDQGLQRQLGGVRVCIGGAHCVTSAFNSIEVGWDVAKRVLVVEDNELNLKLFCDLLRAHDFVTEGLRDGRDVVERARAFAPDLIITDIQLPHVSGFELITQLKADPALWAIPIMAVTAYAGREDEDRVRGAGADAYVSKPISLMRFVEAVNALIAP